MYLFDHMHLRHINNYMILHPVLSFPGYLLFISSITLISHIMVTDTLLILSDYSTKWVEASVLLVRVATSLMKVLCITHYLYSHVYIVRPALKISMRMDCPSCCLHADQGREVRNRLDHD